MKNNFILLSILICLSTSAFALKTDASQPVVITADRWTFDQKNMVSVFIGNVVITQGSLVAHANRANASQDKNGYKTVKLTGTPVTFLQLNDDGEKTEGQGNGFDYNTKNNLAVLVGRARVKKGDNLVIGDQLAYNTQTQVFSATSTNANGISSTKSGRVTVVLQPVQKNTESPTKVKTKKGINNDGNKSVFNFQ